MDTRDSAHDFFFSITDRPRPVDVTYFFYSEFSPGMDAASNTKVHPPQHTEQQTRTVDPGFFGQVTRHDEEEVGTHETHSKREIMIS